MVKVIFKSGITSNTLIDTSPRVFRYCHVMLLKYARVRFPLIGTGKAVFFSYVYVGPISLITVMSMIRAPKVVFFSQVMPSFLGFVLSCLMH